MDSQNQLDKEMEGIEMDEELDVVKKRCATTNRQTTDRKPTCRQKLTDIKIFTDTTNERQRQVADTTTHRQKPIIFLYKTDYHSQLRLH